MATAAQDSYYATHKFARISARKVRYVIDLIRGVPVEKALIDLRFCLRRASPMISKVLRSAVANAEQASGLEPGSLYVSKAFVDEGSTMKRWRPRAMGRAYPRTKRTCHIRVEVSAMPESMKPVQKAAKKESPVAASDAAPVSDAAEDGGDKE